MALVHRSMLSSAMQSSRPGCRGDPRMNRAVAARLDNPGLSLYQALQIGGFDYPVNRDSATVANDPVTLGQRKNQLNRRLRVGRKRHQSVGKCTSSSKSSGGSSISSGEETARGGATHTTVSEVARNIYSKRVPETLSFFNAGHDQTLGLESMQLMSSGNAGVCRQLGGTAMAGVQANCLNMPRSSAALMTRAAPQEPDPLLSLLNRLFDDDDDDQACLKLTGAATNNVNDTAALFAPNAIPSMTERPAVLAQEVKPLHPKLQHEEQDMRQDVAAQLFQSELQNLYVNSMLKAGFSPAEAHETSSSYKHFALLAWKNECERLQTLLAGKDTTRAGTSNATKFCL